MVYLHRGTILLLPGKLFVVDVGIYGVVHSVHLKKGRILLLESQKTRPDPLSKLSDRFFQIRSPNGSTVREGVARI